MNRSIAWGAGALLAIAAVLGISTRSARSPETSVPATLETKKNVAVKRPGKSLSSSVCAEPEKLLQQFFLADEGDVAAPDSCYLTDILQDPTFQNSRQAAQQRLQWRTSRLGFIIAILPDPLHTHFSLMFDRKIEAIQQAAQDAGYDYDSSWLPWETGEHAFLQLKDQDAIENRKDAREDQPGLILFRRKSDQPLDPPESAQIPFQDGLAVLVVGEEATRGVHRRQFQNAAAWIAALQSPVCSPIAILGPTFSGSLPSLSQLMADDAVRGSLNYDFFSRFSNLQVRIYSGSVSGKEAAQAFVGTSVQDKNLTGWKIQFHSFVESDDRILNDYCDYLNVEGLHADRVAFISEDETAYGIGGIKDVDRDSRAKEQLATGKTFSQNGELDNKVPCAGAVRLFYPRDISALRAAYQAQSIFSTANSAESADTQHRTLSTDLADPAGEVHDTVHSYGSNQTPLTQEAQLLGIVAVLQDHHSQILILRSSNTLDQLFLANFFRRLYPEGRIVIRGADTLFLRERSSTGISGVTMLSSYPLISWDWRDWLDSSDHPTHRVFGEETVEGTYVATRFLIQESFKERVPKPLDASLVCSAKNPEQCFVPLNHDPGISIPDYKTPFWEVPEDCQSEYKKAENKNARPNANCEPYFRPATWISVLGRGKFYPLAALNRKDEPAKTDTRRYTGSPNHPIISPPIDSSRSWFDIPIGMKICLLVILGFGGFHLWCCWSASFTAKPAFRAHFAATRNWYPYGAWQHPTLITFGGVLIAFIALLSAWACGAFCITSLPVFHLASIWLFLLSALLVTFGSVVANQQAEYRLEHFQTGNTSCGRFALDWKSRYLKWSVAGFALGIAVFICTFILLFELSLTFQNRLPTYWRSMNLNSGVSPLVPFLVLFAGMYMWFWYSLHGLALFGIDRPQLPTEDCLRLKDRDGKVLTDITGRPLPHLRMFSREKSQGIEQSAIPFECYTRWVGALIFVVFATVACATSWGIPLRSLGAGIYGIVFFILFALCISWMLAEVWQLSRLWHRLKQLLSFLDRIALRRTMSALQGFSWGNVWRMSGNVLDIRYKLLSRQLETLNHLRASFDEFENSSHTIGQLNTCRAVATCQLEIKNVRDAIDSFAKVYAENYDRDDFANFGCLQEYQETVAALVGTLFTDLLIPEWRTETESLMSNEAKESNGAHTDSDSAVPRLPEYIRNAEELVCITYLGFVQNILGRIRTMALGIVWLFVAITVSVSTYPFDPRPTLNKTLVFLFIAVGTIITLVYAEMHRDSTLSRVTNTTPEELGTEFWFKIIGFGVGPLMGLLAYIFPGITDFLFSWLEPGMASFK